MRYSLMKIRFGSPIKCSRSLAIDYCAVRYNISVDDIDRGISRAVGTEYGIKSLITHTVPTARNDLATQIFYLDGNQTSRTNHLCLGGEPSTHSNQTLSFSHFQ